MIQPQQSEQPIFAGVVAGGENNSNLFYTPTATYLPLLLLRQPISKSYSRCPSLLIPALASDSSDPVYIALVRYLLVCLRYQICFYIKARILINAFEVTFKV